MLILNDEHIGVSRIAGTTPAAAEELGKEVIKEFEQNLEHDTNILILGDLFDKSTVDNRILLRVWAILTYWLRHNDNMMYLVRGNHDQMNNSDKLASIDLLAKLLGEVHENFVYITEPYLVGKEGNIGKVIIIPHMANQDLFNMAIDAWKDQGRTLFAHCNYDLHFAKDKDHSLNLSPKQAKGFEQVIIGHEHQHREIDNVTALGCQFPTSVADVKDGQSKHRWWYEAGELTPELTWDSRNNYITCDWRELDSLDDDWQFIRVEGKAETSEASEVLQEIAKLRKRVGAFVVANAVEIAGVTVSEEDMESIESLEKLNIIEMILDRLKPEQAKRIREEVLNND